MEGGEESNSVSAYRRSEPELEATCEIHDTVRIILLPDLPQSVHVLAVHLPQWRPEQSIIVIMRSVFQVLTVLDPSLDQLGAQRAQVSTHIFIECLVGPPKVEA